MARAEYNPTVTTRAVMSAHVIAFPRTKKRGAKVRRGPLADIIAIAPKAHAIERDFFLYASGIYSSWGASENYLDELMRDFLLRMTWRDWLRKVGLVDVERPDMHEIAKRIERRNKNL